MSLLLFVYVQEKAQVQLSHPLILASRSPRRLALMQQIGLTVRVHPCSVPEIVDPSVSPEKNAESLAVQKARCTAKDVEDGIVLGADTIVVIDGEMLGKPADGADAARMLARLSGRTHTVCTGFALLECPSGRIVSGVESTNVTFRYCRWKRSKSTCVAGHRWTRQERMASRMITERCSSPALKGATTMS